MADQRYTVKIKDLHVNRGTTAILQGVNCTLTEGKCTALLGPNGSGKTTLTRVITGHIMLTRGHVQVLGETIGRTDIRALRRHIGIVNPTVDGNAAHTSGSVVDAGLSTRDAIVTGFFATVGLYDTPSNEQRRRADELLDEVGLADRRNLRFGLLSSGEQRRCLIARALVHMPSLLILDEPTAGLDLSGRERVLATIESILVGPEPPTVLMITHHVEELSPSTHHVILLKDGRISSAGPPQKVITPESLSETFGCKVFVKRQNGRFWLEVLPEAWLELTAKAAMPSK